MWERVRKLFQRDSDTLERVRAYEAEMARTPPAIGSIAAERPELATVEAHLRAGRKIDAIKAYRASYRVGLAEAKEAVEAIERGQWTPPAAVPVAPAPDVEALIRAGRKLEAIKLYRQSHPGTGLKEAKDAVDVLERGLRGRP